MIFSTHELKEFKRQMQAVESDANLSPWERLVATPPLLIRLMARTRAMTPRAMTDQEIAERGQFKLAELPRIYTALVWDEVRITEARRFQQACHMDLMDSDTWRVYVQYACRRRPRWMHLKRSDLWADQFSRLLTAWEEAMNYVRK